MVLNRNRTVRYNQRMSKIRIAIAAIASPVRSKGHETCFSQSLSKSMASRNGNAGTATTPTTNQETIRFVKSEISFIGRNRFWAARNNQNKHLGLVWR